MADQGPLTVLDSLPQLLKGLLSPASLIEGSIILGALLLAWGAVTVLRPRRSPGVTADGAVAAPPAHGQVLFGDRGFDGLLFPLLALGLVLLARLLLQAHLPLAVFKVAVPVLASLAVIRVVVRVLRAAFPGSMFVRALERTVSWGVWGVMVLWLTDLLPLVLAEMEALHWKISGTDVSLRGLLEGALSAVVVLVAVLWLSATLEARLLAPSPVNLSVRKIAANATRAGLMLVGVLIALSVAGIPLGALSVIGGAVGVGIGFGLQKLAANYVSGFVILAERSLRIGDTVRVDNFEGRITDITTRYTVIRAGNGRESIVPNEMLITQRVENCSFADPNIALKTVVQVAYGTDLPALMPQLVAAVARVPRVLAEPAPSVQLVQFAPDGLDLAIGFWINDLHNGQGNVLSDVNLAILATLGALGVEIPFPQRVVHGVPASDATLPQTAAPP